ncbi:MAG: hypothetical protein EOP77_02660 [Variovorax sp.]|nr:MAG: hypothetical protein EOP77_02660 [Variovorax sp.]
MNARQAAAMSCLAVLGYVGAASVVRAAPLTVTIDDRSTSTACAEEDNVSIALTGRGITRFTIEALQPAYLAAVSSDVTAPDFTGCTFDGSEHPSDPRHRFTPRTRVLHDGPQWRIVGLTLATFWRPQRVPVSLDGVATQGIHLLQVFKKIKGRPFEVIVLYPSDGYWRIKPLPEARFGDGLYGSSLLIGPSDGAPRPAVSIRSVAITTKPLSLRLAFANGVGARVDVGEISRVRTSINVTLRPATGSTKPFAILRSMYVMADNADVSQVLWRNGPAAALQHAPLPLLSSLEATEARFGRSTLSRHNTSAPDLRFSNFR